MPNEERKLSFGVLKRQGAIRKAAKSSPEVVEAELAPDAVQAFQRASKAKRKRKGRVRRRERE